MNKKKNSTTKIKYSGLTSLFLCANGFYENFKNVRKQMLDDMGRISYNSPLPVATSSAFFAIELYLKLIHGFTYWEKTEKDKDSPDNITNYPNGHDLRKLFDDLDEETQDSIFVNLSKDCSKGKFLNTLDKYKDGFIVWRYVFEKDKDMEVNLCSISFILEALYKFSLYYMNYKHCPKKEWLENTPHTIATYKEAYNVPLDEIQLILQEECK